MNMMHIRNFLRNYHSETNKRGILWRCRRLGLTALQDLHLHSSIQILSDSQSQYTLSSGPASQSDSFNITTPPWVKLTAYTSSGFQHTSVYPAILRHSEAKLGITPVHGLARYGKGSDPEDGTWGVHACYVGDKHCATHCTLTRDISPQFHWRLRWSRSQCITIAQLRTVL